MISPNSLLLKAPNSTILKFPVFLPLCCKTVSFSAQGLDLGRMGSECCGVFAKKKKKIQQFSSVVESRGVGNGVVVDASMVEARVPPQHLIIMVNGLIGSLHYRKHLLSDINLNLYNISAGNWFPKGLECSDFASDWKFAADQFVKQLPDKVIVHRSQCNPAKLTFDGVDMMGERLADEVLTVIRHRPDLQKISFVAHSLGGLVARYAIGRLYEHPKKADPLFANGYCLEKANPICTKEKIEEDCRGRIAGLEMMNFVTVATPHLGSRGHKQLPFLCGLPFLERQAKQTAHLVAGRSGKHLFLTDNDEGGPPLLVRMVSDSYELKFISALSSFKRRVAYANVSFDHIVGWSTSSIRRLSELPKANLLVKDGSYDHIVYSENQTSDDIHHKTSYTENQIVDLEEEMIQGLNQVPWERVDVSFHQSRQRYIAHNTIQVKSYWLNSDGADVIFHMIHKFLV